MQTLFLSAIFISTCFAENFELKATPQTVVWGYYSASAKPALRIHSGDTVRIETMSTGSPAQFEAAGVPANQISEAFRSIFKEVNDRGPGRHILTGPLYIEGAEPGDVLEVRIRKIELASPFAYNGFRPGFGFLQDDFLNAHGAEYFHCALDNHGGARMDGRAAMMLHDERANAMVT